MSNSQNVVNPDTGEKMRYKRAKAKVAEGSIVWIVEGETWRNATFQDLPQIMAARLEYSRLRAPIASAEIPGIKVEGIVQDFAMIRAANQYAQEATA